MRNLLAASAVLVLILGTVSFNFWHELRSSRLQLIDLQDQLARAEQSAEEARAQAATAVSSLATMASRPPAPQPAPPAAPPPPPVPLPPPLPPPLPVLPPDPASPAPVVSASVRLPLTTGTFEERRAEALMQSDVTATARVRAWSTVLSLTPEQLRALNETAMAELRVETEESLEIDSRTGPLDARAAAQLKVETLNRQHATNLRILEKMTPQLNADQATMMRTMFEAWIRPRLLAAQAEQERAAQSPF